MILFLLGGALLIGSAMAEPQPKLPETPLPPSLIWPDLMGHHMGQLRKGMACLPSGHFMLSDVNLPPDEQVQALIPAYLSAEVQQVQVGICSAYMGIGNAPASTIKLTILWKDRRADCDLAVSTSSRMKRADARSNSKPMVAAITENLHEYQRLTKNSSRCARGAQSAPS